MNKHFALNVYQNYTTDDERFHLYSPYKIGMDMIIKDFNALIQPCNVKTVDESRVRTNSPHHPYMTYMKCKPIRKGIDIITVAMRTYLYSGVIIDSIPYAGKHTYINIPERKPGDEEMKMDNVMHQLFNRNGKPGDVWVHDSRFTSVQGLELAHRKGMGCIGQVDWTRVHLPRFKNHTHVVVWPLNGTTYHGDVIKLFKYLIQDKSIRVS